MTGIHKSMGNSRAFFQMTNVVLHISMEMINYIMNFFLTIM